MSKQIMSEEEVTGFVDNVFKMFDSNNDAKLDFEEFILATSGKDTNSTHVDKLVWLFDNVYDKVFEFHIQAAQRCVFLNLYFRLLVIEVRFFPVRCFRLAVTKK